MVTPGVMGAGVGASDRADGEAVIVLYVNKNSGNRPNLPDSIDGIPVTVVLTDEFIAR
jgi:ABC-type phosphate transport system permease subunit